MMMTIMRWNGIENLSLCPKPDLTVHSYKNRLYGGSGGRCLPHSQPRVWTPLLCQEGPDRPWGSIWDPPPVQNFPSRQLHEFSTKFCPKVPKIKSLILGALFCIICSVGPREPSSGFQLDPISLCSRKGSVAVESVAVLREEMGTRPWFYKPMVRSNVPWPHKPQGIAAKASGVHLPCRTPPVR